ncbi:condensation domain-containing protein [Bythopirellula goksoeyrii]|uniref:Acyltransferase PapA5 n=1 Tax=Bythopirellula goksoeyrii TaxID=1400387 RepID=A0A5B9QBY1_9BACT|nr:condensation domain-containing protein [Bythopirellula goksoeyrii]QEG35085.1 acyltransferase PapA5 [Bythopirellula goksoeyrii]
MADELFPLPLTPFEFYYWCDDRPEYPTTFPMELVFRGPLNRESLETAIHVCLDRHPLLAANVDDLGRYPQWIAAQDKSLTLDWRDDLTSIDIARMRFMDLTKRIGVRLSVRTTVERSRLVLQFHHACCDALGALQFVADLLVAYDSAVAGENPVSKLEPLEADRLKMRGDYGLTEAGYTPNWGDAWRTARFWMGRMMCRPAVVASPRNGELKPAGSADLGYVTHVLSKKDRNSLLQRAVEADSSINDLLLAEFLVTLKEWNQECGSKNRQFVVNVPVSLRSRSDQRLPAANVLGFWFLQRNPNECSNATALLPGIHKELEAVKKWRLPLFFIGGLGYAYQFPGFMRRVLRGNKSFATAVLSNSGRALARLPLKHEHRKWISGGAVLERITGVPPVRPGTRVSIIIANYAYDTTVNLHWDQHELDETAARELLAAYVRRIKG